MSSSPTSRSSMDPAAFLPAVLGALLLLAGCFSLEVGGTSLAERREVAVHARILSDPPGATVTDLDTGEVLGRTPLETEAFVLGFEEWKVLNEPERRRELLQEKPEGAEGSYAVASEEGGGALETGSASGIVLRYRLEREGFESLVLSRAIEPSSFPLLQKEPLIVLEGSLTRR